MQNIPSEYAIFCYDEGMQIKSAIFVKGIAKEDDILENGIPQIAFIGRSNVGKSSIINSLTNQKDLAITSSFPGRTQQVNLFLINKAFYLVDLPGYGFAKASKEGRDRIQQLINWYLFTSEYEQKIVVLIIDANVGLTDNDLEMLRSLEEYNKNILIVANKVDKIKNSEYQKKLKQIQDLVGQHKIIAYSSKNKIGINALFAEVSQK